MPASLLLGWRIGIYMDASTMIEDSFERAVATFDQIDGLREQAKDWRDYMIEAPWDVKGLTLVIIFILIYGIYTGLFKGNEGTAADDVSSAGSDAGSDAGSGSGSGSGSSGCRCSRLGAGAAASRLSHAS